jgi:phosphonate transport system substrate-binding protein
MLSRRNFLKSVAACVAMLSAVTAAPARAENPQLVIGIISPRHPQLLVEAYQPLKAYLESEVGCSLKLEPGITYAQGLDAMKTGKWDLAFATNETYLEARPFGFKALVMVTERGNSYYRSILVVPKDSPIKTIKQLKGKRVAFVSKKSASGYIYPMKLLLDNGLSPATDLKLAFTGNARIIGNSIANKGQLAFDAGAVYDGFIRENPMLAGKLRVLAESQPIPHIPVVAGPRVVGDRALFDRFQRAFLDASRKVPEAFTRKGVFFDGFLPPQDKLYEQVTAVSAQVRAYEKRHPIREVTP